jgi:hypothetical protein
MDREYKTIRGDGAPESVAEEVVSGCLNVCVMLHDKRSGSQKTSLCVGT